MHPQPGPLALSPSRRTGYAPEVGGTCPAWSQGTLPFVFLFPRQSVSRYQPRVSFPWRHLGGVAGTGRVTQAPGPWSRETVAWTGLLCCPASLSHLETEPSPPPFLGN